MEILSWPELAQALGNHIYTTQTMGHSFMLDFLFAFDPILRNYSHYLRLRL